jgi:hypothetical protein
MYREVDLQIKTLIRAQMLLRGRAFSWKSSITRQGDELLELLRDYSIAETEASPLP